MRTSALVLLAPPNGRRDGGYYDAMSKELFDFYADFHRAAASVEERTVLVVGHDAVAELLRRGVPRTHLLEFPLDDIWIRDSMATQLSDSVVARFAYAPAYLDRETVHVIDSSTEKWLHHWNFTGLTRHDDLVLDGGGIVFAGGMAVLTERILRDNPALANRTGSGLGPAPACCPADPYQIDRGDDPQGHFTAAEIALGEKALEEILGFDRIVLVPEEPGVPRLGHIDGIANWLAPGVLALSNYSDPGMYQRYERRLLAKLNITIVAMPYAPVHETYIDGFESAKGIYVNFLRTKRAIYLPIFGLLQDELALAIAQRYADRPVVPVHAGEVAILGGSVRCLSQHLWGENARAIGGHANLQPTSHGQRRVWMDRFLEIWASLSFPRSAVWGILR